MDYYKVSISESFFATATINVSTGVLRDQNYFPHFRTLPDDDNDDIDIRYEYYISEGVSCAAKTWCLLAEIVDDSSALWGRHTIQVQDDSGCIFSIYFYTDDTQSNFSPFLK